MDLTKRSEEFALTVVSRASQRFSGNPFGLRGHDARRSRLAILVWLGLGLLGSASSADGIATKAFPLFLAGSEPQGVALGPDGNVWFTETKGSRVGRVTPDGKVDDWSSGSGISAGAQPEGITAGRDGNLWFTEISLGSGAIGRITTGVSAPPTAVEFPTGVKSDYIAAGPDGNLWFTEYAGRVGYVTPSGTVTVFTQGITPLSGPAGIAAGPDGNLWFTEQAANRIGRITPSGVVTEFSVGISPNSAPVGITAGPDGNLWFTEGGTSSRIGRITTAGVVTEFSDGIAPGGLFEISQGPDGNLWFTDYTGSRIGRITTAGVATEFPVGTNIGPAAITTGADGRLWFAATLGNAIWRVTLDPLATTGDASVVAATAASMSGTVNPLRSATTYAFEYGTTTAYGSTTAAQALPPVAATIPVSGVAGGLAPGTTYHYRVVATNEGGKALGADRTLTIPAAQSVGLPGVGGVSAGGPTATPKDRSGPRMSIVNRALSLSASRRVRVTVRCPRAETLGCHGSVRLEVPGRPTLRLGAGRFRMGGGQSREVSIKIASPGLSLLRSKTRKRVRIVVNGVDVVGNVATTAVQVTLLGAL